MGSKQSTAVIICHYQQANDLRVSLKSVACQVQPADQVIVVDDGSAVPPDYTNLTSECDGSILLLTNKSNSGGPAIPRNEAVLACQCTHVVFLDAGDVLLPHTLKVMSQMWIDEPIDILYGDQVAWGDEIKIPFLQKAGRFEYRTTNTDNHIYEQMLMNGNQIFFSGSGGPREAFQSHPFNPNQRWEDFDLWLRLAKAGLPFKHTGSIHTFYRIQRGSRSGSRGARILGSKGIKFAHFQKCPFWRWPLWYWKQRFL